MSSQMKAYKCDFFSADHTHIPCICSPHPWLRIFVLEKLEIDCKDMKLFELYQYRIQW
jgi:hypothetical protein